MNSVRPGWIVLETVEAQASTTSGSNAATVKSRAGNGLSHRDNVRMSTPPYESGLMSIVAIECAGVHSVFGRREWTQRLRAPAVDQVKGALVLTHLVRVCRTGDGTEATRAVPRRCNSLSLWLRREAAAGISDDPKVDPRGLSRPSGRVCTYPLLRCLADLPSRLRSKSSLTPPGPRVPLLHGGLPRSPRAVHSRRRS
jgi:hypothetical protein